MSQKDVGNKVPIYKLKKTDEVMKYYDEWGEGNKYDKDMVDWNYTGPKETTEVYIKYEKNKNSFEEVQKRFRYLKLSPEILIGNKIVNEEYFKKIDSIENSILDGEDFDSLTSGYKNDLKNISFINSERIKSNGDKFKDIDIDTFNKIFKSRKSTER